MISTEAAQALLKEWTKRLESIPANGVGARMELEACIGDLKFELDKAELARRRARAELGFL